MSGESRRPNCHACGFPLDGATVRLAFEGFTTLALNGVAFTCHARCVRLVIPDRKIELPPRIPDLVYVGPAEEGWIARCREHGGVAIKDEEDDAHLAAARHLARVHSGLVGT